MATANRKQTHRALATRKRSSKKAAKGDQNAYVRSLSEGELMSRLRRRYADKASSATQAAGVSIPEATSETITGESERKATGKELVCLAQNAMGIVSPNVATILAAQAAAMAPSAAAADSPDKNRKLVETAVQLIGEIKPEGPLESMLAVQMIGVHNSAVKFLMRATDENQTFEGADANVLRSTRLMRLFNEQLQTLASLRGKTSEQKVIVEHVHVYPGGQAIVGNVTRGEGVKMEIEVRPHGRCGARTRAGAPCRRPSMPNGRCRLHGGLSTGPKTSDGRNRIRAALLKHGRYTKEAMRERLECRELVHTSKRLLHQVRQGSSDH